MDRCNESGTRWAARASFLSDVLSSTPVGGSKTFFLSFCVRKFALDTPPLKALCERFKARSCTPTSVDHSGSELMGLWQGLHSTLLEARENCNILLLSVAFLA